MGRRSKMRIELGRVAAVMAGVVLCAAGAWAEVPERAAGLFEGGKVWTVQLRFTAEAWAGLEPKNAAAGWGPIMAASQRKSAADPTWILASTLVKAGDANHDGRVD